MKRDFTTFLEKHFQDLSEDVFAALEPHEELTITLEAEDTLYLRFNNNRIRQNTNLEQIVVGLKFQSEGRSIVKKRTLSGDSAFDKAALEILLQKTRQEIRMLPVDPFQIPLKNNGQSRDHFKAKITETGPLLESICDTAEGNDLAGLYCGGTVIHANRNSRGQDHWFAAESFFMDYSLYNGKKAAKGIYAHGRWDKAEWAENFQRTKQQLEALSKAPKTLKPGKYRTYLAPAAVSEMLLMFSYGAVSAAAVKHGRSPFIKLAQGEKHFSPMFTLRENFGLGFSPRFNDLGEVSEEKINIIENGLYGQFLTSSRTALEFDLTSNAADEHEMLRSPEILTGALDEKNILRELDTGLYVSNLHYLNWSDLAWARCTGMTRYACLWVEKGQIVGPISDLRFDESFYDAFGSKLIGITRNAEFDPVVSTYGSRAIGGKKVPGLLIEDFTYTL